MNKLFQIIFLVITSIIAAYSCHAAPTSCTPQNMSSADARTDKAKVRRGESITFTIDTCYEPPQYSIWAKFREAPDVIVPLNFDDGPRLWSFTVNVTQEIQPGTYHVDFLAKSANGDIAYEFPLETGVAAIVVWDEQHTRELENWHLQKESLIDSAVKRLDDSYSSIPKFPIVGVWFDSPSYHRHHITNSEATGPWNPFLRKTYNDEIDYISKTLGLNMIMLSGGSPDENRIARQAFPYFITSDPEPGDYAIFDEPDFTNTPPEDVIKWAAEMKDKGVKTIVNFSGHKADDTWADYAFNFLELYTPDVVSVDCYPVFYDFANMEYFRTRIKSIGKLAHSKNAKFIVIVQGFAQLGTWSYPTTFYWQKMLEAARDAKADGVLFFLWTSGADGRNFVVGIDAMPQEYHRLLHSALQKNIPPSKQKSYKSKKPITKSKPANTSTTSEKPSSGSNKSKVVKKPATNKQPAQQKPPAKSTKQKQGR